jgi:hypothetical protein
MSCAISPWLAEGSYYAAMLGPVAIAISGSEASSKNEQEGALNAVDFVPYFTNSENEGWETG